MNNNKAEQVSELKALRREYKAKQGNDDEDTFEFLGPKVPEATEENPTRMKIDNRRNDLSVIVTMPAGYPSVSNPIFKVVGGCSDAVGKAHEEAIEEMLAEQASYMPGMTCVATCLTVLDDLDLSSLDLGTPGRFRSIFKVDVVNNSKQFIKSLKSASGGNPCVYFYRTIECQNNAKFSFAVDPWRAVYCLCDSPDKREAVTYMKTIRTDGAMDMDMLGKPGRIQMTVIEEFEIAPKAKAVSDDGGFGCSEYRTDDDLDGLMNHLMAAAAGV